jgi:putative ATP-binding cassette transporter
MRVYQLNFAGQYGRNPDQRIQEDTRLLGDYSADLGCGLVYSLLQSLAFVGVLWTLSAHVTFQVAGYYIAILGYMVWCALAYALIGSVLTWIVGRPLALNVERYAREAEFRFALIRVNESAESIALHAGEMGERRYLEVALAAVVDTMRRLSTYLAHLTWVTSGTGWVMLVAPILVAAPAYFRRQIDSRRADHGGRCFQPGAVGDATVRRQLLAYCRLAAAIHRVAHFREALDTSPAIKEDAKNSPAYYILQSSDRSYF